MEKQRFKYYLEIATNVAVLIVAILIIATFVKSYYAVRSLPQLQSGLQKGMSIKQLPGINYDDASQTLLVVMNTKCHFCSESVPFYKQLEQQSQESKSSRIVAVFPNSKEEAEQYMKDKGLSLTTVAGINLSELNLAGTPTLILVDNKGMVQDFWAGKLPENTEKQVFQALGGSKEQ